MGDKAMEKDDKAIVRGMVRVAMYHGLPKNEWMAQVVPGVEDRLGTPLSEKVVDQIHEAFRNEWPPEMAIDEVCFQGHRKLIEELAENIGIAAGDITGDEKYLPIAKEYLKQFQAAHQRDPVDSLELETFFLARQQGEHLKAADKTT
jgi:hypothetical protein